MSGLTSASVHVSELWDNCVTNYVYVISCTLMTYDFLLTLDREVMFVWPSPWSAVKILFLLNRYTPFLSTAILLYPMLASTTSEKECLFVQDSTAWLKTVGMLVAEVILVIRTWAVYERQRSVGIGLAIWTTVIWVGCMTSVGIFLRSLLYEPVAAWPAGAFGPSCHVMPGNNIVFVSWILFMAFEALVCGLMIHKSATAYRADRDTAMFRAVFRDGTIFYVYLFALSIGNVITIFSAPADLAFLLSTPSRMVHSILTTRLILNLREIASSKTHLCWSTFSMQVRDAATGSGELEFASESRLAVDGTADINPDAEVSSIGNVARQRAVTSPTEYVA